LHPSFPGCLVNSFCGSKPAHFLQFDVDHRNRTRIGNTMNVLGRLYRFIGHDRYGSTPGRLPQKR